MSHNVPFMAHFVFRQFFTDLFVGLESCRREQQIIFDFFYRRVVLLT